MPITKSAKKRVRQVTVRNNRNKAISLNVKNSIKELLESIQKLTENALSKNAIVYDIDDQEFKDIDFSGTGRCEIEKASDELNDEDSYYFVI